MTCLAQQNLLGIGNSKAREGNNYAQFAVYVPILRREMLLKIIKIYRFSHVVLLGFFIL